jgi:hypothetical protein
MTPARRQKLEDGLAIISDVNDADAWDMLTAETRAALIGIGAAFVNGNTNTMRLAGVTASCTFHPGEHLLLRWAANARAALAEGNDANLTIDEEE